MSRHVAFLRGMNLGGRRIANRDLAACFEALGFADVATFRASGNVILTAPGGGDEAALVERIETGLAEALGYEVTTFLRSTDEVRAVAAHEPFDAAALAASKGKLQVAFLHAEPGSAAVRDALAHASADDRLAVHGRELYWLPCGGLSDSALDVKAIARALGDSTIRTKGTVELIAARHCD